MDEKLLIIELQDKIQELSRKLTLLNDMVNLLNTAKAPDPRNPYANWRLINGIDREKKRKLEFALFTLTQRLNSEYINQPNQSDFIEVPIKELLLVDKKPEIDEIYNILKLVLEKKDEDDFIINTLVVSLCREGRYRELCEYIILEQSKNGNNEIMKLSAFI
ncbi:hypothetical protein [Clostridium manihotivorum]|uniref:Uncharacterized protein n=1 Tax=Clostridium manihotivorum TaxID=2320868 RepID=A0A3R5V9F5_9CLOT|nr:hypothetical protein [Clostridium manihotivorum]QAA33181.1 hypothetical protein C1I91_16905 [Clostridium manihotivorum]